MKNCLEMWVKLKKLKMSSTRTRSVKPSEETMPEPVNPGIHGTGKREKPGGGEFNKDETSSPA